MQNKKYFLKRTITSVSLLVFVSLVATLTGACGASHNSASNSDPSTQNQPTTSPIFNTRRVCYDSGCLTAQLITSITDPKGDYKYADPATFPTSSLRDQYLRPIRVIDLQNVDMDKAIADNFVIGDFMNVTRGRYAIFSPDVVTIMQDMRDELKAPIIVNSGYRSPGHNGQTDGSALWSRHMYGDGVDFTTPNANYTALQALCTKHEASFTLIYAAHIHCDWRLLPLNDIFYADQATASGSVARAMAQQGTIEVINKSDDTVTLEAKLPDLEDEGEAPIYSWSIVLPNQTTLTATSAEIQLPKMPGHYTIKVEIGGSIDLATTLDY